MDRETPEKPVETGFETFHSLIGSANKSLDRIKSRGMDEYGLSGTYTMCLRQLYAEPHGLTRTELAQRCYVDRAQITRVIGELLKKELVLEIGSGSNYRKRCVLTEKGREVTDQINGLVGKIQHFVSGDIPPERLAIFYETLYEICERLRQAEDLM